jgi:septum formation protein
MRKIILASTSPRRKELLEKAGLVFEIVASDYEEDMTLPLSPSDLVKFLSRGKAESVALKYSDAIVIGGDTIVFLDDNVLGKPHTKKRAKEMLTMLSGKEHSVFSGFTIIDTLNNKIFSDAVEAKVKFKDLSDVEIEEYIETGEPLSRAGAYALQTVKDTFVEYINGDYDSIIGFPITEIMKALKSFNI